MAVAARRLLLWFRNETCKAAGAGTRHRGADFELACARFVLSETSPSLPYASSGAEAGLLSYGCFTRSICQGRGKPEPRDCGLTGDIHTVQ